MTTVSFTDADGTDRDILFRQYVSDPLVVQTIPGQTIRLQVRGRETLATQDMFLTWSVKVVSEDGGTVRGTLASIRRDGTELDTVLTNRGDSAPADSITLQSRDRLVFEIGTGGDPLVSHDTDLSIGDDNATDLPQNDTETSAFNPWIELGATLTFDVPTAQLAAAWGLLYGEVVEQGASAAGGARE